MLRLLKGSFYMAFNELALLATIIFIGMISPGPDFLLVTRNSLIYPRKQALATALGIVMGCLLHATYCILGLALIITKSVILFSTIKYAGACYLLYLGIKCLTSKISDYETAYEKTTKQLSVKQAFIDGFLCNALNPKLAVFLLSLFTQFIKIDATFSQKCIVAGVLVIEAAIYWPLLVCLLQSELIRNSFKRFQLQIDRTCGAMLCFLGIRVAFSKD